MLEVVEAEHIEGYKIHLVLSDGTEGTVDLEDSLWGEVFEPLRNPDEFRKFTVSPELHTLAWPNHADFAPEHLRRKMIEQGRHTEAQSRTS
ncbi:MAG: DUF2442 domain-containing protein [Thermoguttaceae bacterium]